LDLGGAIAPMQLSMKWSATFLAATGKMTEEAETEARAALDH